MARYAFEIVRSHPMLGRLAAPGKCRVVPEATAQRLSQVDSIELVKRFMVDVGIEGEAKVNDISRTAYAVNVSDADNSYYGIQVIIPRVGCELVPFGSLLINFLIPDVEVNEAERILGVFNDKLAVISQRLGAYPFACITGNKTNEPPEHDLCLRGFRFFFSPNPGVLYERINEVFCTKASFGKAPKGERASFAMRIQELKRCEVEGGAIMHSFLEDIKAYPTGTTLVDMR